MDHDRVPHRRAEHHQAHDRGSADPVAVLLDLDHRVDFAGEVDELGARPGVEAALVLDPNLAADSVKPRLPRESRRDGNIFASRLARRGNGCVDRHHLARALEPDQHRQVHPGDHLDFSLFISLIARLEGVPPNKSVRMITPWPGRPPGSPRRYPCAAPPCCRRDRSRSPRSPPAGRRHAPSR